MKTISYSANFIKKLLQKFSIAPVVGLEDIKDITSSPYCFKNLRMPYVQIKTGKGSEKITFLTDGIFLNLKEVAKVSRDSRKTVVGKVKNTVDIDSFPKYIYETIPQKSLLEHDYFCSHIMFVLHNTLSDLKIIPRFTEYEIITQNGNIVPDITFKYYINQNTYLVLPLFIELSHSKHGPKYFIDKTVQYFRVQAVNSKGQSTAKTVFFVNTYQTPFSKDNLETIYSELAKMFDLKKTEFDGKMMLQLQNLSAIYVNYDEFMQEIESNAENVGVLLEMMKQNGAGVLKSVLKNNHNKIVAFR